MLASPQSYHERLLLQCFEFVIKLVQVLIHLIYLFEVTFVILERIWALMVVARAQIQSLKFVFQGIICLKEPFFFP